MNETFHAFFDFNESTIGHDVHDAAGNVCTDRIFCIDFFPRIAGFLFETERNAFLVIVDIEDHDFDFLTDIEEFAGIEDAGPGHISDVEEAVDTAEIDECTEVSDVFDSTFTDLTDLHILKKLSAHIFAGFCQEFAAGNDDILAIFVDLQDLQVEFLANVFVHVLYRADIDLGTGEERFHAIEVDDDTAFDAMFHETLDGAAFAIFGCDAVPCLDEFCFLQADSGHILFIFDFFEEDVKFVTDFGIFPACAEFYCRNETFSFVADIKQCAILSFFHDTTVDDGVGCKIIFGFCIEEIFHREFAGEIHIALGVLVLFAHFFCFSLVGCLRCFYHTAVRSFHCPNSFNISCFPKKASRFLILYRFF